MIPPLWGPDSFNDGAGMARLITIANFVHFNMPHGSDYLDPRLATEDAWDVAAYVASQPRPSRAGFDHDFPDLLQKPVDTPYGPVCRLPSARSSTSMALCTDPRRNQASQTGTSARRAMTPRILACGRRMGPTGQRPRGLSLAKIILTNFQFLAFSPRGRPQRGTSHHRLIWTKINYLVCNDSG